MTKRRVHLGLLAPVTVLALAGSAATDRADLGSDRLTVPAEVGASPAVETPASPVDLPDVAGTIDAAASLTTSPQAGAKRGDGPPPTGDIPAVALSAYQRAESIINAADEACGISWQLVAAIGSVESDHGRYGGSTLDDQGRATPAILGPVLDGGPGMARIRDTDAGQYDGDQAFDRAVGPLQFIPSTWAIAGVDADDDGRRDPQDIDDAALAAAVYLCSGPEDLATRAGQESAVHRYNHSDAYVDLVLSRAQAYLGSTVVGRAPGVGATTTRLGEQTPGVTPPVSTAADPSGRPGQHGQHGQRVDAWSELGRPAQEPRFVDRGRALPSDRVEPGRPGVGTSRPGRPAEDTAPGATPDPATDLTAGPTRADGDDGDDAVGPDDLRDAVQEADRRCEDAGFEDELADVADEFDTCVIDQVTASTGRVVDAETLAQARVEAGAEDDLP